MADNSIRWVVKLETDQVKGPYSAEAICKMILNGAFSGNEMVCLYPEGEWKQLTKQPEFYEALLESLENPIEVDSKKAQKMDAETVIRSVKSNKSPSEKTEVPNNFKSLFAPESAVAKTSPVLVELPLAVKKKSALAPPVTMQPLQSDIVLSDIKNSK